ncbi:MAG: transporter [Deltaproteobacteria bacterium]|nr:transporter [Deltaproteobacteria bacterium]
MRFLRLFAGTFTLLAAVPAVAQPATTEQDAEQEEEVEGYQVMVAPIATDRPGNGNAATTVPQWALQIETSANYALERIPMAGDQHLLAFPTLLRFGLLDIFEIRLGSELLGIDGHPPMGQKTAHPTDTWVGLKIQLAANDGAVPAVAIMTDLFLPSGRAPFTNDAVVPDIRGALSWSLPKGFGLLLNAGIDIPDDGVGRFARALYVVNLGYAFPFLERRLSVFVESFGLIPLGTDRDAVIQFDWGAAFRITRDMQIDFFAQHGLTEAATDFQIALGFSARFFVH